MKNHILSLCIAVFALLSIQSCKKDYCKESPCLNGASCESVDDAAVCTCTDAYEGTLCADAVNKKFAADYDGLETSDGGVNYYDFICNVRAGSTPTSIIFDNLDDLGEDITATIGSDKKSFVLVEHTFTNGGNRMNGHGTLTSSTLITMEYYYSNPQGDTITYLTATLTKK